MRIYTRVAEVVCDCAEMRVASLTEYLVRPLTLTLLSYDTLYCPYQLAGLLTCTVCTLERMTVEMCSVKENVSEILLLSTFISLTRLIAVCDK